jgi:hypothetical protein
MILNRWILVLLLTLGGDKTMAKVPVIGFIGASYSSAFRIDGTAINGGRYMVLPDALRRISDYWVVSTAWAGAGGNDYGRQANDLVVKTTTDKGELTLDVVVIDIVGQCALNDCTNDEQDNLVGIVKELAVLAYANNVKVIVTGYPEIAQLQWREKYQDAMQADPLVHYVQIYDGAQVFDGVHPVKESMMIAAVRLKEAIEKIGD